MPTEKDRMLGAKHGQSHEHVLASLVERVTAMEEDISDLINRVKAIEDVVEL